jgi:hypothetical protein
MLRHVALVRTDVSEELRASIIPDDVILLSSYSFGSHFNVVLLSLPRSCS